MKIVVAMDSFKGTLSAREACECTAEGLRSVAPDLQIVLKPMADGGEGTAAAMIAARQGAWVAQRVTGPLPSMQVEAGYAWFAREGEALVEMAAASGITLLRPDQLNPMRTTTFGTGQLIRAAAARNPKKILLAVGGSATVDGGIGAAGALGWTFLDARGRPVELCGGSLTRITALEPPVHPRWPPMEVLCDVHSPLCGEQGAAHLYGPQKGATPEMVRELDRGLKNLGELVARQLGKEIVDLPGAGAAGGLSAGAVAFMNARLVPGIETVMKASGLEQDLREADWIITGEGKFDSQSLRGKVVSGIVSLAGRRRVRVAVIAGSVQVDPSECRQFGVETALATQPPGLPLAEALANAGPLLGQAAQTFARRYVLDA